MRSSLVALLKCPLSAEPLDLVTERQSGDEIQLGWLVSRAGKHRYPIRGGIPRFVPAENYAATFGFQWNLFSRTQLDSYSSHDISARRFWTATNWSAADLRDKWILDVGCGSGRFAEIALGAGARVVALDYSSAADACYNNIKSPNLHVVQADVYALPFQQRSFDFVYSLGMLQHTPDVERAFFALPPMLKPGGFICVDFYERSLAASFLPKRWLRPFTKRMDKPRLLSLIQGMVPKLLPLTKAASRVPVLGRYLKRIVPVPDYGGDLPLTEQQRLEWAILDTFDWLSPAYDNPQRAQDVRRWLRDAGFQAIEVLKAGHLVGRGSMPAETT